MAVTPGNDALQAAIARARAHSPFLKLQLEKFPDLSDLLVSGGLDQALEAASCAGDGAETVASALRRERSALSLVLGIGDLAGSLPLEQVVGSLSDFADRAAEAALAAAFASRAGGLAPAGFVI